MAARRRTKQSSGKAAVTKRDPNVGAAKDEQKKELDSKIKAAKAAELAEEHLAPLPLVFTVLICSGALWVLAFRDVFATGRIIAGPLDGAMQLFTKSTEFFDDSRGWKSTQGGLSTIHGFTTDANNMGGLFVRKVGGAAVLAVHTQKLLPLLFHPSGAQWTMGHFKPLFFTAILGDLAIMTLYGLYMDDLAAAGADGMATVICGLLAFESLVMLWYLLTGKSKVGREMQSLPEGKTPKSVTSRIVTKTVALVSGFLTVVFVRDLFFPGHIIGTIPRDDVYLEWTGAFLHSPPENSPEAIEQGMEAPLYIGDKFLSQMMALHILILCVYKFVTAFVIRFGPDGSGQVKCRMIWKAQALGDGLILLLFRLFTAAAQTASLDLRWHLVCIAYETFILGMYGFL